MVITAGAARKPGMPREDLLTLNAKIIQSIVRHIVKYSPEACIIIITNPLDAMTYVAYRESGLPREKIMGMSGVLDSTRFKSFIAQKLRVSYEDVFAMVIGGHGDNMVPVERFACVAGLPVEVLLSREDMEEIKEKVRNAGGEIVKLLKTNASFSVGAGAVEMVESIMRDKRRVFPCSIYLEGEYGLKDICIGVPVVLGAGGVERIIEVELKKKEKSEFMRSAKGVKELIEKIEF